MCARDLDTTDATLPKSVIFKVVKTLFVVSPCWRLSLRRAMLSKRHTGAALGDVKLTPNMLDANAPACGT